MTNINERLSYPAFYIGIIIFTILLDDLAYNEIEPIFGILFDKIKDEYIDLKNFVIEYKKTHGVYHQIVLVEAIKRSKLYKILKKICEEKEHINILKKSYNIARSKWKDLDGNSNSEEGMRNFSMFLEDNRDNNCICGKSICKNVIIHHKNQDTKIVIGSICMEAYDKKEVIFGKIETSEFHKWIKSIFKCINHIKNDNGTLEHFQKSNAFIEKCFKDRTITKEEKEKYEFYSKFYSKRNDVYTLLVENLDDLKIITCIYKKICDRYLHPSNSEYKEKYDIENILFNKNETIILKYRDRIMIQYKEEKRNELINKQNIDENECDYELIELDNDEKGKCEYVMLPKSVIFENKNEKYVTKYKNTQLNNKRGFIEYEIDWNSLKKYHRCETCSVYYKIDKNKKIYPPNCPECWGRIKYRPNKKIFESFNKPLIIKNPKKNINCSNCDKRFHYVILKHHPIPDMDHICKQCAQ